MRISENSINMIFNRVKFEFDCFANPTLCRLRENYLSVRNESVYNPVNQNTGLMLISLEHETDYFTLFASNFLSYVRLDSVNKL